MKEFVGLTAKTYAYLMDNDGEKKKAKGTKQCVIKRELMFKNYTGCLLNNEIILKSQQRFKNDYHDAYTERINKIALSSNDDKRLQTFDKITTYPYGTNAFKVCEREMLRKYKRLILMIMQMKKKERTKRNSKWPYIPDCSCRILIIGSSGSGKTNALLHLINNQSDIDKIYLYTKDPCEAKYQFLIKKKKRKYTINDPKAFIEYSNDIQDVYKNINEYNPGKKLI